MLNSEPDFAHCLRDKGLAVLALNDAGRRNIVLQRDDVGQARAVSGSRKSQTGKQK